MAWSFFTFSINRRGVFPIFSCAHEMEGWQWSRWGVTFPTFTLQIKGRKRVTFNIFTL